MPKWPPLPGRRNITLELPSELLQHLDSQASRYQCSRAAYLRRLIVQDLEAATANA